MRAQKQRRSAESRRRVGLLLQQLRWLAGFPDEGGWRTCRGEVLSLDGALLSRWYRTAALGSARRARQPPLPREHAPPRPRARPLARRRSHDDPGRGPARARPLLRSAGDLPDGRALRDLPRPGRDNFFSVVSNAVDINKRVLYARRGGRVAGRCLLALSDDASLLTFHPHCHESIPFGDLVADFARSLARRMGAEPASSGTIAKLIGGTALEALNRPRQAIALYRHALEADLHYLRDDLTARLRRLDKHRRV